MKKIRIKFKTIRQAKAKMKSIIQTVVKTNVNSKHAIAIIIYA